MLAGFVKDKVISLGADGIGTGAASAAIGGVLVGVSIVKFIGNLVLGVDEYVKASAYIECYARLSEMFAKELSIRRSAFLVNETQENAELFRNDYITLWNLRKIGEETYKDMISFDKLWSGSAKKLMRSVKGYDENKAFLDSNISALYSREFTMINDLSY